MKVNFELLKLSEKLSNHIYFDFILQSYAEKLESYLFMGRRGFSSIEELEPYFEKDVYKYNLLEKRAYFLDGYLKCYENIRDFTVFVEKLNKAGGDIYNEDDDHVVTYKYGCIHVGSNSNNKAFYPVNDFDKTEKNKYLFFAEGLIIVGNYHYEILTKLNLYSFLTNKNIDFRISDVKNNTTVVQTNLKDAVRSLVNDLDQYYDYKVVVVGNQIENVVGYHYDYASDFVNDIYSILKK